MNGAHLPAGRDFLLATSEWPGNSDRGRRQTGAVRFAYKKSSGVNIILTAEAGFEEKQLANQLFKFLHGRQAVRRAP